MVRGGVFHELRVHGVAGTPSGAMLGMEPELVDPKLGLCGRPSTPPGITISRWPQADVGLRAYSWGSLTSGTPKTAFYVLLLPYMLANVAGWMMLPIQQRPGTLDDHAHARGMPIRVVTLLVRLAGMVITMIFALSTLLVAADLGALQWLIRSRGWPAAWLGAGVILAGAVILLLSYFTRLRPRHGGRYGRSPWRDETDPVGYATIHHEQQELWDRPGIIVRLRRLHLAVGWASVALVAALARPWTGSGWQAWDVAAVALAVTALLVPVGLLCAVSLGTGQQQPQAVTLAIRWVSWVPALAAVVLTAARAAGADAAALRAQPFLPAIRGAAGWVALALLAIAVVAPVVAWRCRAQPGVPSRAAWNLPGLLLLAAAIGAEFGVGVALQASRLIGDPDTCLQQDMVFSCVGSTIDWLAIAFTAALAVVVSALLVRFLLAFMAGGKDAPQRVMAAVQGITSEGSWLLRLVTILALPTVAGGLLLAVLHGDLPPASALPRWVAMLITALLLVPLGVMAVWRARPLGLRVAVAAGLAGFAALTWLAALQEWRLEVLGVALLPVQLVSLVLPTGIVMTRVIYAGVRDHNVRRGIGILWDIGTFWPRWFHPFAPPTYSDRIVTDLTARLDDALEGEDTSLLLAPHSQGSVIAAAAILGMDPLRARRLALLTYGSPLGRHYTEFFPAYFAQDCLDEIASRLTTDGAAPRWRNLYRKSDPLGGPIPLSAAAHVNRPALEDPCGRLHSSYHLEQAYKEEAGTLRGMLGGQGARDREPFIRQSFTAAGFTHDVLVAGAGPGVILLHEVAGLSTECLALARDLAADGFTVFAPVLYGAPGQSSVLLGGLRALFCLRRELHLFTCGKTSPMVAWLRELADHAAQRTERERVGIIGMCMTGGLVLGTLAHTATGAAVASQPSLPLVWRGRGPLAKADLGLSPADLDEAASSATPLLALRFTADTICPAERFDTLRQRLGTGPEEQGASESDLTIRRCGRLTTIEIDGDGHSVLTLDRHEAAVDHVRAFLRANLS